MERHIKEYNNITIPYEQFVKKCLLYANSTSEQKIVKASLSSRYVKIKEKTITIPPFSSGSFKLRIYFEKTAPKKSIVSMEVEDNGIIE